MFRVPIGQPWRRIGPVVVMLAVVGYSATSIAAVPLRSDFDGDGFDELVVAAPGRAVDGVDGAGIVIIVPGAPTGVDPASATQVFHRAVEGVPGDLAEAESWGMVIDTADFNSDGYFDLAIGSPTAEVEGRPNNGDVVILFGSENGLTSDGALHFLPDAELGSSSFFGAALASGAFYTDPFVGLAIGAPGAFEGSGAVVVYRASLTGGLGEPTILRADMLPIEEPERRSTPQAFGAALVAGQFNQVGGGFGRVDLAIASQQSGRGGVAGGNAGRIYVAVGGTDETTRGLSLGAGFFYDLDLDVAQDFRADPGLLVSSMATGDLDGDGALDIVFGVPTATFPGPEGAIGRAGAVAVLYGDGAGLTSRDEETWRQDLAGFRDEPERGDEFGAAIVTADFDDDGRADLAIGTPFEMELGLEDRGLIHLLYGTEAGLTIERRLTLHHDMEFYGANMGQSAAGDLFAAAFGTGDFDGDGFADLAVGVPGRVGPGGEPTAGKVVVLRGSERGATTAFSITISFETLVALDLAPEAGDYFGLALSGGPADCWLATLCMRLR